MHLLTLSIPPARLPTCGHVVGWSTFNAFHRDWNESVFKANVDAIARSGLLAAGYNYANFDGGYWADLELRGPDGKITPDPARFPSG